MCPTPCIGCGRGGGSYVSHDSTPPTSNAARHWLEERGAGGPAGSRRFPLAHHPLIALENTILSFSQDANTVETREKQVEGALTQGQHPPTLTQLPLWCKKKKKKRSLWG